MMARGGFVSELPLNLSEYMPFCLATTSSNVSARIAETYQQQLGLRIPEWRIVAVLGQGEPLTQRILVSLTQLDKVTINRAAKALERRGLIERKAHDLDGRSHHLMLTEAGEAVYRQIVPIARDAEKQVESLLDEQERTLLMQLLAKLNVAATLPSG
jgi:DNA-binding MarR family transcriptional regulator